MKLAVIFAIGIVSVHSFACEKLIGKWSCVDTDKNTFEATYKSVPDGLAITTVESIAENNIGETTYVLDGKDHRAALGESPSDAKQLLFNGKLNCENWGASSDLRYFAKLPKYQVSYGGMVSRQYIILGKKMIVHSDQKDEFIIVGKKRQVLKPTYEKIVCERQDP
jgi:hypothetical protein